MSSVDINEMYEKLLQIYEVRHGSTAPRALLYYRTNELVREGKTREEAIKALYEEEGELTRAEKEKLKEPIRKKKEEEEKAEEAVTRKKPEENNISSIAGALTIIGGLVLILSIAFGVFLTLRIVSEEVGRTITLGEILGILRQEFPNLYALFIIGIMVVFSLGILLLVCGFTVMARKGTDTIAALTIIFGVLGILFPIVFVGGIVGSIGGILGIIGGSLSLWQLSKKKE